MYVTGCQTASCSRTASGESPSSSVRRGTIDVARNPAIFAQMSALTAGVGGPGPNAYERVVAG